MSTEQPEFVTLDRQACVMLLRHTETLREALVKALDGSKKSYTSIGKQIYPLETIFTDFERGATPAAISKKYGMSYQHAWRLKKEACEKASLPEEPKA